jgi:predicted RNase H-like nuclease (RuvC/YqgF family)
MFQTISIRKLHREYHSWIVELNFCKEEIHIYEGHLEEIISKYRITEITSQVEHFQNQFIRHKEVVDELKHDLNIAEKQLAAFSKDLSDAGFMNIKMDNHTHLREEVHTQRKIFEDLKREFRSFEAFCGFRHQEIQAV